MDQENIDPQEEGMPTEVQADSQPIEEWQSEEPQESVHEKSQDPAMGAAATAASSVESLAKRENRTFVAQKRMWTVAFVCVLGVLLIAACIKAIEPNTGQQSLGSTKSETVNTPTAVQEVSEAPTATAVAETAAVDSQTGTTETVVSTEPTVASANVTTETATVSETTAAEAGPNEAMQVVTSTESYNGVPVGFTAEGYPFRGSPDAPVIVYEYSDFQCPFCSRYFVQTEPAINESFVRLNKLRVVFRDFPLVELHPNAPAAHYAAQCVAQQGAALFWAMHDALFRSQNEWARLPDPLPIFKRLTGEISSGETKVNADAYDSCMAEHQTVDRVEASVQAVYNLGFSGTPSFRFFSAADGKSYDLIGAQPYDQFASYIDTIAAGQAPVDPQAQQQQQGSGSNQIPIWASAEGLAADPDHPGVNKAGDYYRGNLDASVVVIEFSDFQCPYCKRHEADTQPTLDEQFVNSGKVLWVFKSFPLNIHPQADEAAVAAECAADQGKFWEMHDLLFKDPTTWSIDAPAPIFSSYAQQLGLDVAAFDACQQGTEAQQRVQSDMNDGSSFVRGTPSFIILKGGEGRIIPGALPKDEFVKALDDVVNNGFSQ
ncbi:MAG: thioredoxin domain-containing protein [Caldilineaceae bacterium]